MASETTNYQLVKPDPEEFYDVSVPNGNMEKIDVALNALSQALGGIDLATLSQAITSVDKRVTEHLVEDASLTEKGHVQLSNATNSTSEVMASTPKAVKTVNDTLTAHVENRDIHVTTEEKTNIAKIPNKLDKTGGTVTGDIGITKDIPALHLSVGKTGKGFSITYNANEANDFGVIISKENGEILRIKGPKDVQFFGHDDAWMSLADLKSSVGSGKAAIANATSEMGVPTVPDAEFATIAANIRKIVQKPKTASGSATANQYGTLQINGLGFKPTYVRLTVTYNGSQYVQHFYYPIFGYPYVNGGSTVYPTYGSASQISTAHAPGGMYEGGFQLPTGVNLSTPVSWLATDGILF